MKRVWERLPTPQKDVNAVPAPQHPCKYPEVTSQRTADGNNAHVYENVLQNSTSMILGRT